VPGPQDRPTTESVDRAFGNDKYANIFLLGLASQSGVLPLSPDDIEWGLELNGVKVKDNQQAFRLGRQYVIERSPHATAAPGEVAQTQDRRTAAIATVVNAPRMIAPTDSSSRRRRARTTP